MNERETIRKDSATFAALHKQVNATFLHRDESARGRWAWEQACDQLHKFNSPMFELVSHAGLTRLSAGDPEMVERAICFLEVDPFHFRSGYNKAVLIRRLKRISLSASQQSRLRGVVFHALDDHDRPEYRYYCRLAASVQTAEFIECVRERLSSPDAGVRRRARFLIDYVERFNRGKRSAPANTHPN